MKEETNLVGGLMLVVGLLIGTGVGYLLAPTNSSVQVNDSDVDIIRVPQSFGNTVSVSISDSRVVILFENGLYVSYRYSGEYQIVWEDT